MRTALIVGRLESVVENAEEGLHVPDVKVLGGTGIDDVRAAFAQGNVDVVIMGAGIDLDSRLEIVRAIFELSDSTSVHMKDRQSGPQGFLPFIRSVLSATASPATTS